MTPCRQAMSSSSSPAASPARSASRSSSAIIGSFRSPPGAARTNARNSAGLHGAEAFRHGRAGRGGERPDELRERDRGQALQPGEAQQRPHGVRPDLRGPGPQSRGDRKRPGPRPGRRSGRRAARRTRRRTAAPGTGSWIPWPGPGRARRTAIPRTAPAARPRARPARRPRPAGRYRVPAGSSAPAGAPGPTADAPLPPAGGGVLAGHLAAQPGQWQALVREPACQVPQQRDLCLAGPWRVPEPPSQATNPSAYCASRFSVPDSMIFSSPSRGGMRRSSLNRSYAALCGEGTALTSGGTAADRRHRHNHAIGIIILSGCRNKTNNLAERQIRARS